MAQTVPNPNCAQCEHRVDSAFGSLSEGDLPILTEQKICRRYRKGETLFFAGDDPGGLYCIHHGKIKMYRTGNDGKEQIIRLGKAGDILGYRALIGGEPHTITATTLEEAHVCFIPKGMFFSLLSSRPAFSLRLFEILSDDVEVVERKVVEMAQKSIRERLAEALLLLKSTYGMKPNTHTLNVKITREDIAGIVGAATESVIRNLTELKDEGIIGLEGRAIQVLDSEALVKAANLDD